MRTRWVSALLLLGATVAAASCAVRVREARLEEVSARDVIVTTPIKAHLRNGGFVIFRSGAEISSNSVRGNGMHYNMQMQSQGPVTLVSLDSVLGIVNFRDDIQEGATYALSTLATATAAVGTLALYKALFGSCPTFYTTQDGEAALEAEGFSYSIAPLFEARDVDALRHSPASAVYRLEVRNEALETHYINQLELLSYEHPQGTTLLPDGFGHVTSFRGAVAPRSARDADGRDVLKGVARADAHPFGTADARLAHANVRELSDYIELDFGIVATDSAALVLRARNSLLTTVLLYDVMLADAGARAFDWLAQDMGTFSGASEVANWYKTRMGLRVDVFEKGAWRTVARVPDTGPIAWKDVAIMLPVPPGAPLRARLHFPADNWRIDHVYLGLDARSVAPTVIPIARVLVDSQSDDASVARLRSVDQRYLITEPGRRFFAEFDLPPSGNLQRTFMLASQGYYSEWIRPHWIREASPRTFVAGDAALLEAMQRWRGNKAELEAQFYATRIPVQ